jgi:Rrf2 family protein
MLSATADYALRAVLYLARCKDGPMTADAIARGIGAPRNYLAKTLNVLARHGILSSNRGPTGGFALIVRPDELSLARLIGLFDETPRTTKCLLRDTVCSPGTPCSAHERWQGITRTAREALANTSVANLLE